jgi:hypothetical protein
MATYRGNNGVLLVAANAVAELTEFSITTIIGMLDDTAMGDSARSHMDDGLPDWSGTMTGHYFPGDTNGQAVVIEGAELAFEAGPSGTTAGLEKLSGNIIVSGVTINSANGAVVSFTAQFQGTGGLTRGTYA